MAVEETLNERVDGKAYRTKAARGDGGGAQRDGGKEGDTLLLELGRESPNALGRRGDFDLQPRRHLKSNGGRQ